MRNPRSLLPGLLVTTLALALLACTKTSSEAPTPDKANVVEITGFDYAFQMPDSLPPGRISFRFANKGKVDHEFNIVLLKTTATLKQFIDTANADQSTRNLIDGSVGVLFAKPGMTGSSTLSVDLLPGRTYAIQCINKDKDDAPTHRQLGMFKSLTVTSADRVASKSITTDTIFGTDYAFKIPPTFTPGLHHLGFFNSGKQHHEINVALLKPDVTVQKVIEIASAGGEVDSLIDGALGVLHSFSDSAPLGTLDIHFLPGREYIVVCTFMDTPNSPPHFALGMFGSIKVAAQ
ncbi:MAG: hypothetical protein ABJC26_03705 [Gemmatimonadaceae bacterium]